MELEEDATVIFSIGSDFPYDDVKSIATRLAASNCLVPGFIAPVAGLASIEAFLYSELVDQASTTVIVDRNVASRMAQIARDGAVRPLNGPTQIAVDLMALAQSVNLNIDPSIAFHELAHLNSNADASEELRWFRAADHGQARAWIDVALGREDALPLSAPTGLEEYDLSKPLFRWRRNYTVMLKAAELELSDLSPKERMLALLEWMISDFMLAGPAAIYCAMYFAPFATKAGMFKQLRSPNRDRALNGIKNAAWDVTYLSELVRHATSSNHDSDRFILATADKAIAQVAPLLFLDAENLLDLEAKLSAQFEKWWQADSASLAMGFARAMSLATERSPPQHGSYLKDYVGDLIAIGEASILANQSRNWRQ
ncbi:hypothetical protein [uncultured Sulfitobacter sp.]|uniref:hypothetical protein n=1 Tax=uncultured Sulfitobacter sp. TaxID=191468 RepID=UPI0026292969|nr:hypothetical protein [uncultured Sulfitobacter sp.]